MLTEMQNQRTRPGVSHRVERSTPKKPVDSSEEGPEEPDVLSVFGEPAAADERRKVAHSNNVNAPIAKATASITTIETKPKAKVRVVARSGPRIDPTSSARDNSVFPGFSWVEGRIRGSNLTAAGPVNAALHN